MNWTLSRRAEGMNPSVLRDILKLADKPGIISLAGGLPSPSTFPVEAMAAACAQVLESAGPAALQYAASEGYAPLREWVAGQLAATQGMAVDPQQVLITTGSQQALDLIGKVLIDAGSRILVETPTYLGALQAFSAMEPRVAAVDCDDEGPMPEDLARKIGSGADRARFMYVLPSFQNPTGRTMGAARRAAFMAEAARLGLPVVEDNPYGELWFEQAPPPALSSHNPGGSLYMGSFSKILAPGLRLGYVVAPPALFPKLLQAKQAADLHTPIFNQRVVAEVLKHGFIDRHVPAIRALYRQQRDAMLAALAREMAGLDVQWTRPAGGMFLWLRVPEGIDTLSLLARAVERRVAFVPGAAFHASAPARNTLRLSFVTASAGQIDVAIRALADALRDELAAQAPARDMAAAPA